jgi:hypothetical protein
MSNTGAEPTNQELFLRFEMMQEKFASFQTALDEIRNEQRITRAIFERGRGALFVLSTLGVILGIMMTWGRDMVRGWLH